MKPAPRLQLMIQTLAAQHGVRLEHQGVRLCLRLGESFLLAEYKGSDRISVGLYQHYNGRLIADPEVTVQRFTHNSLWIPIAVRCVIEGQVWRIAPNPARSLAAFCATSVQKAIALFTEAVFVPTLVAQGWLEHSQNCVLPIVRAPDGLIEAQGNNLASYEQEKLAAPCADDEWPVGPCPEMQQAVERLAASLGHDLSDRGTCLELTTAEAHVKLTIRTTYDQRVIVTYRSQINEEFVLDFELIFLVSESKGWLPLELVFCDEVWEAYLRWFITQQPSAVDDGSGEANFAYFAAFCAQRVAAEQWLLVRKRSMPHE